MQYALTGATGFIGQRLAHLLRAQGHAVRALVRERVRAQALENAGCELVEGDLDSVDALATLCAGAERVVHAAGAVRGACAEDFEAVNVRGTQQLIAALAAETAERQSGHPPQLLLLSSLAAREPGLSWYAQSKAAAERLLLDVEQTFSWVILRPPAVYGPGDRELLPLFRSMRRGIAPLPGSAMARVSLLHVDDLLGAIIACLDSPRCAGQVLSLHDGQHDGQHGGYSWREIAGIAGSTWGRRVRLLPVPRRVLDIAATLNIAQARRSGRAPMLTPAKLRELRHPDWSTSNELISRLSGWQPQWPLAAGLAALSLEPDATAAAGAIPSAATGGAGGAGGTSGTSGTDEAGATRRPAG
jgi:nucleoside-diphosphate-sugar epimerase